MKLQIKEFREEMHLTQRELAEKVGNVQRNVSNWENGVSEPDCQSIIKLAKVLDVTIDELFGLEGTTSNRQPLVGVEYSILKSVRNLSEKKQVALMHFLKELEND